MKICWKDMNSVDVVKEEICGNMPHDDPQTSMFVDLAEKSNGEIVFAVDEHGNKIAVGVILKEDFANNDVPVSKHQYTNCEDEDQFPWLAAEEECVSMSTADQEFRSKDDEIFNVAQVTCDKANVHDKMKSKEFIIKVYKVSKAARKTLRKMKLPHLQKKTIIQKFASRKAKNVEIIGNKMIESTKKRKKNRRLKVDKAFPMPQSICEIHFDGNFY